jgi:hypothetical protein
LFVFSLQFVISQGKKEMKRAFVPPMEKGKEGGREGGREGGQAQKDVPPYSIDRSFLPALPAAFPRFCTHSLKAKERHLGRP